MKAIAIRLRLLVIGASAAALLAHTGPARAADELTLTLPVKTVSFAPIFLAIDGGYFAKQNISMKIVVVRGGLPAISSLIAGDAQFVSVADDELLKVAKSGEIIRVYSFANSFSQNLQVRNAVLADRGVTMDMPVYDRVRRLKGITFGVIVPGGSSDLAGRWLFKQAGLDHSKDMTILRIGGLPALVAAMKNRRIDAFVLSAPAGPIVEAQGIGKITVRYDEVPEFADEPFLGIDTSHKYMEANRDIVERVVKAVAEAQAALYEDPAAAATILKKGSFASVGLPILERSLKIMRQAYRPQKMSAARWEFVKSMRVELGRREFADVEMKEGAHWTNAFYPDK